MPVFNSLKPPLFKLKKQLLTAFGIALALAGTPLAFDGLNLPAMALPLYTGNKSPIDAMAAGKDTMERDPSTRTVVDYASLCFAYGDRNFARKLFQKAIELDKSDWRAHLGYGQCVAFDYSLLSRDKGPAYPRRDLDLATAEIDNAFSLTGGALNHSRERYVSIGDAFAVLHQYKKSLVAYQSAQSLPASALVTDNLLRHKLVQAWLALDRPLDAVPVARAVLLGTIVDEQVYADICGRVLPLMPADQLQSLAAPLTRHVMTIAGNSPEILLALGRTLAAASLDRDALDCLVKANQAAPRDAGCALALAHFYSLHGEKQKAIAVMRAIERLNLSGEPGIARTLKARLYKLALDQLEETSPGMAGQLRALVHGHDGAGGTRRMLTTARFTRWQCNCKMTSQHFVLMHKPGVDYAYIQFADDGVGTVIYDPLQTNPSKIWSGMDAEVKVRALPATRHIDTFDDLALAILEAEAAHYEPSRGIFNFDAPPLSVLPDAQTTPPSH